VFVAALRSKGFFPEVLQGHAADCLSHLSDDVFAARESLNEYLLAMEDLLQWHGADKHIWEVLEVLRYALVDLQRGVLNPLLTTEKKSRAKPQFDVEVLARVRVRYLWSIVHTCSCYARRTQPNLRNTDLRPSISKTLNGHYRNGQTDFPKSTR
jgi:hypothetical protein